MGPSGTPVMPNGPLMPEANVVRSPDDGSTRTTDDDPTSVT